MREGVFTSRMYVAITSPYSWDRGITEALRDALANSESFLTYMSEIPYDDAQSSCPECHHIQSKVPAITFTVEDMLLKDNKHDRPLYYTGYIGLTCIERVQVDPGVCTQYHPQKAPLLPCYTTVSVVFNHLM